MKLVVTKQHFDMSPGTIVYRIDNKPQAITNEVLTSLTEDGKTLRLVPADKMKPVESNTEVFSPFETVNS
jgi:hypothetical protein